MSYYYDLCCLDCNEEVPAVSSQRSGNNVLCDLGDLLDFIVDHHGHRLVSKSEDESLLKGKIEFNY